MNECRLCIAAHVYEQEGQSWTEACRHVIWTLTDTGQHIKVICFRRQRKLQVKIIEKRLTQSV